MRKKSSVLEDIVELAAKLPWWVNIALAVISYFILYSFANQTNREPPAEIKQLGGFFVHSAWAGLVFLMQFILPLLFILAAVIAFIKQKRRETLWQRTIQSQNSAAEIRAMSWQEFERLIGAYFRHEGYRVSETRSGADGGVDLILHKGTEKFFVQCKHWKAQKVSVNVVRELYGVMNAQGAVGGFVATSGTFTADAQNYAHGLNITLIDGVELNRIIQQAKTYSAASERDIPDSPETSTVSAHLCPKCGKDMVKRTAKQGRYSGKRFWGCPDYPACKGILPFEGE